MSRPIIFLDANTVWHRRLAEELAKSGPLVFINPKTGFLPGSRRERTGDFDQIEISLPRGWASRTAFLGQRMLSRLVECEVRKLGGDAVLVLTSPAYAPLASRLAGRVPIVSYIADDYRSYEGWGGSAIMGKERKLHLQSDLSVFVSEALRDRAVSDFKLDLARTFISPNATEHRFARNVQSELLDELVEIPGPVTGIIGALTDRLNVQLLADIAACPEVGTFLVAGPASGELLTRHEIFASEKCLITGYLDHSKMHLYAKALDLALIPYAENSLNYHCSPMRFYDHLATGAPILALKGCDQIDRSEAHGVEVVEPDRFVERARELLVSLPPFDQSPLLEYFWDFRATALRDVLDAIPVPGQ